MAKKTAVETTEEQVVEPTIAPVVEETKKEEENVRLDTGWPSRDFFTPLNQG
jgi:hypothetical protein